MAASRRSVVRIIPACGERLPSSQAERQKTVIVTGGNSGIGLAVVRSLLDQNTAVLACDVNVDALQAAPHPLLKVFEFDVRDGDKMAQIVAGIPAAATLAGLVTCAAVFKRIPFLELDETLWDTTFEVNLTGTFLACQVVVPRMRQQRSGSIVVMSSSLARSGSPTGGHYAATKGGVLGLARSLALEVAADGVRVNVVSPGLVDTPQPRAHAGGAAAMMAKASAIPLGRIGHTQDVVNAVEFLLGDESSFVTGQDIQVNGGSQIG